MSTYPLNKPKTVQGASVGILMLETHFPRIPGDIGNADSWDFPVHYRVVRGVSAHSVVTSHKPQLPEPFIEAAKDLIAMGADGITTSCGFLSLMQKQLSAATNAPVAASSLMQVSWVEAMLPPGKRVGVLTIQASSLTPAHLLAAGAAADTPVAGTEAGSEFTRVILNDEPDMNVELCRTDNLMAAQQLVDRYPELGAIVLECTNMVPYAADIQQLTGLPVFSIHSFINWFQSGLLPRRFSEQR